MKEHEITQYLKNNLKIEMKVYSIMYGSHGHLEIKLKLKDEEISSLTIDGQDIKDIVAD